MSAEPSRTADRYAKPSNTLALRMVASCARRSMLNGQMDGFAGYPPGSGGRGDFGFGGLEDMYGQMANQQMAQWGVQQPQQVPSAAHRGAF